VLENCPLEGRRPGLYPFDCGECRVSHHSSVRDIAGDGGAGCRAYRSNLGELVKQLFAAVGQCSVCGHSCSEPYLLVVAKSIHDGLKLRGQTIISL
jgi:hypothetical protein